MKLLWKENIFISTYLREKKILFNLFKNVNENNSDYIIMWKLNELFVSAM